MGRIVVGTSSWADPGFVAEWYPDGLPARDRLGFYAQRFEGVEVNSTWYALPGQRAVARWVDQTPEGFTFDWKLHRALSRHAAQVDALPADLRAAVDTTPKGRVRLDAVLEAELARRTLEAAAPLVEAGRLSSFLLQLSPAFAPGKHALDELDDLVAALAPHPVAVELRHRGWLGRDERERTLGWYEERGAVWVGVDAPQGKPATLLPPLDAVTDARLAYVRAHGRNLEGWVHGRSVAERFGHRYADDELRELVGRAQALSQEAQEVRLVFNNNRGSDAPVAAERARELLGQAVAA
ncbi:DUF72 domain-containing protein [Conexibacter sp. SYSU D00693]|uniref:DUF72 domain-containing protein n=1 Tax=Conexibacter sp. SYSU D00693 TaxID=2812560 RepID=UPI00196B0236|nr:DUF72 domain-containing protein [Conexibacter sp. SYSU D00693]